jgi:hypothetical protein
VVHRHSPVDRVEVVQRALRTIRGGDYRAHDRSKTEVSDYKKQFATDAKEDDFFDLRPLLREHLRFSSQPEYGLEASDILVNVIRRSMSGNFQRRGWLPIRSLMIHRAEQYVRIISLREDSREEQRVPYRRMLNDFRRRRSPPHGRRAVSTSVAFVFCMSRGEWRSV